MQNQDLFNSSHSGRADYYLKEDAKTGLQAIIATSHSEQGPALGGCRFAHYDNTWDAISDASRLASTMAYKSSFHGLPFSGGKSVIIAPKALVDKEALFHAFGDFVDSLKGRYIAAMDSGVGKAEINAISERTTYVTNFCKIGGAPSAYTAKGVSLGIQAAVKHVYNREDIRGLRVLIQGVGKVGFELMKRMLALGADVIISDTNEPLVNQYCREYGVKAVLPCDVYRTSCDIFAPCAIGRVFSMQTIGQSEARIIAGAANNPLSGEEQANCLYARHAYYIPDYVINAGGLIFSARQCLGSRLLKMDERIERIYDLTLDLLRRGDHHGVSPLVMANRMVHRRMRRKDQKKVSA